MDKAYRVKAYRFGKLQLDRLFETFKEAEEDMFCLTAEPLGYTCTIELIEYNSYDLLECNLYNDDVYYCISAMSYGDDFELIAKVVEKTDVYNFKLEFPWYEEEVYSVIDGQIEQPKWGYINIKEMTHISKEEFERRHEDWLKKQKEIEEEADKELKEREISISESCKYIQAEIDIYDSIQSCSCRVVDWKDEHNFSFIVTDFGRELTFVVEDGFYSYDDIGYHHVSKIVPITKEEYIKNMKDDIANMIAENNATMHGFHIENEFLFEKFAEVDNLQQKVNND